MEFYEGRKTERKKQHTAKLRRHFFSTLDSRNFCTFVLRVYSQARIIGKVLGREIIRPSWVNLSTSILFSSLGELYCNNTLLFQVHCAGEGWGEAALSAEDIHLVLGISTKVLKVQNTDQDHLQDRGKFEKTHFYWQLKKKLSSMFSLYLRGKKTVENFSPTKHFVVHFVVPDNGETVKREFRIKGKVPRERISDYFG